MSSSQPPTSSRSGAHSRSSRSSRRSSSSKGLKKFTRAQIQEKVEERRAIAEYYEMLMECAVKEDESGVYFNLRHPSFTKLVTVCRDFDEKHAKGPKASARRSGSKKKQKATDSAEHSEMTGKRTRFGASAKSETRSSESEEADDGVATVKPLRSSASKRGSAEGSLPESGSSSALLRETDSGKRAAASGRSTGPRMRSDQQWLDVLTAQLQRHQPNSEVVREACKHIGVPVNLRSTIWKILLDVPSKRSRFIKECKHTQYQKEKEAAAALLETAALELSETREASMDDSVSMSVSVSQSAYSKTASKTAMGTPLTAGPRAAATHDLGEIELLEGMHDVSVSIPQSATGSLDVEDKSEGVVVTDGSVDESPQTATREMSPAVSSEKTEVTTPGSGGTKLSGSSSTSRLGSLKERFTRMKSSISDGSGAVDEKKTEKKKKKKRAMTVPLRDSPPPLRNQRVIQADVERTRATLAIFQDSKVRSEMTVILTEYCIRHSVSYKQGMNYVLAPFIMVGMKSRLDIYLAFESFIEVFMKTTFTDDDFGSLQCIFRLFRLLLQYHEPMLSIFLDQQHVVPELFAAGWFMTLHANKCEPKTLLHLWDNVLLFSKVHSAQSVEELIRKHSPETVSKGSAAHRADADGSSSVQLTVGGQKKKGRAKRSTAAGGKRPKAGGILGNDCSMVDRSDVGMCFHYFVDVELLRLHKSEIFKKSTEELPAYLVSICFDNRDVCRRVIQSAFRTFRNTPQSFHDLVYRCCKRPVKVDSPLYAKLESLPCLPVNCSELLANCFREPLATLPFDSYYRSGDQQSAAAALGTAIGGWPRQPQATGSSVKQVFAEALDAANEIAKTREDSSTKSEGKSKRKAASSGLLKSAGKKMRIRLKKKRRRKGSDEPSVSVSADLEMAEDSVTEASAEVSKSHTATGELSVTVESEERRGEEKEDAESGEAQSGDGSEQSSSDEECSAEWSEFSKEGKQIGSLNLAVEYSKEALGRRLEAVEYFASTSQSSLWHSHSSLMRLRIGGSKPPRTAPPPLPAAFDVKYFVIDCRSLEEYSGGHLPCAFHLDPALDMSSEELRLKLKSLLTMSGCHLVVFMDGRSQTHSAVVNSMDPLRLDDTAERSQSDMLLSSYLLFFLEKRVKYVSVCDAGYMGCHLLLAANEHLAVCKEQSAELPPATDSGGASDRQTLALRRAADVSTAMLQLELIDHNSERCYECNGQWKHKVQSSGKGFNSLFGTFCFWYLLSLYKSITRQKITKAAENPYIDTEHSTLTQLNTSAVQWSV